MTKKKLITFISAFSLGIIVNFAYAQLNANFGPAFGGNGSGGGLRCDQSDGVKDCYFYVTLSDQTNFQLYKGDLITTVDQTFSTTFDIPNLKVESCLSVTASWPGQAACTTITDQNIARGPFSSSGGSQIDLGYLNDLNIYAIHIRADHVYTHTDATAYGRRIFINNLNAPASATVGQRFNVTWGVDNTATNTEFNWFGNINCDTVVNTTSGGSASCWGTAAGTPTVEARAYGPAGNGDAPGWVIRNTTINIGGSAQTFYRWNGGCGCQQVVDPSTECGANPPNSNCTINSSCSGLPVCGGGPTPTPTITVTPTPTGTYTPTPTPVPTGTPTPTPPKLPAGLIPCDPNIIVPGRMIICDFEPSVVPPGGVIYITGYELSATVNFTSTESKTVTTVTGLLDTSKTLISLTVPATMRDGDYSVEVAGDVTQPNGSSNFQKATLQKLLTVSSLLLNVEGNSFGPTAQSNTSPPATDFQDLISKAFNYAIILVGIAVFIMIMWGGFLWLTSAANPGNISRAKGIITNAIIGAVLLISAYVILYSINPELVGGQFNLTGIPVPPQSGSQSVTRLIATNDLDAASAITAGCPVALEIRDVTAVECPTDTASLTGGLSVDPVVEIQDSDTNQQINATVIQTGGNLGAGRRVVVLDTGYNYNNPDLSSSYGGGMDFVNNDNDPMDDHTSGVGAPGHGSHVAGIITGDGIDSRAKGVAPKTQIVAGKILNNAGQGYWSTMIAAIYWAVNGPDGIFGTADDFKADAINISVGGDLYSSICDDDNSDTKLMAKAIQYAKDNGVLTVVAAGNRSSGITMPGCIDAAFTVGAVDSSDRIASFSGRGNPVDVTAPGVNLYSTLLGNNYGIKSGTSQATPVVSGLVALTKAANPNLTAREVEQKIESESCDLGATGKDPIFGWGRVTAVPGSCATAPTTSNVARGTLSISPSSCTKNTIAGNPDCNLTINYTAGNLTAPISLSIFKDGSFLRRIDCPQASCTGQIGDPNPRAGIHRYSLQLPNNTVLSNTSSYVYTTGSIITAFTSCTKLADPANPNCDINFDIKTSGISPNPVLVKKDGVTWRVIQCPTPACNSTTDANPNPGIHTYTLNDSSDDSRLARVTITIQNQPITQPACLAMPSGQLLRLCTGLNYTGTCVDFTCTYLNNFSGTPLYNQQVNSAQIIKSSSGVSKVNIYNCEGGAIHPLTPDTRKSPPMPYICAWREIDSTNNAPNIWDPAANNWCWWEWIGGSPITTCGKTDPITTQSEKNIRAYGSQ